MNAKPALVRPRFASDLDPQVALWIARLSTNFLTAINQFNEEPLFRGVEKDRHHAQTGNFAHKPSLKPLLKIRA